MINETIQDKSMSDIKETQHRYNYKCEKKQIIMKLTLHIRLINIARVD